MAYKGSRKKKINLICNIEPLSIHVISNKTLIRQNWD